MRFEPSVLGDWEKACFWSGLPSQTPELHNDRGDRNQGNSGGYLSKRFSGLPNYGLFADAEEFGHLFVQEALAGLVGLDPFAVDNELRDGTLAYVRLDRVGRTGRAFDVDFGVWDVVGVEEALGFSAVAAPGG
jgi:hypothetical protein